MKERLLTGWTFTRVLYVVLGSLVIAESVAERQWLGVGFGFYFAAMGLFAIGCAAGNCYTGFSGNKTDAAEIQEIQFEEIKKGE